MIGVAVAANIWPGTKPGPKTLWFYDTPITFDLIVEGWPQ